MHGQAASGAANPNTLIKFPSHARQSGHSVAPCTLPLMPSFPLCSLYLHLYFLHSPHPIGNLWCYVNSLTRAEPTHVRPCCHMYNLHLAWQLAFAMASLSPFRNLCINSEVYWDTHICCSSVFNRYSAGLQMLRTKLPLCTEEETLVIISGPAGHHHALSQRHWLFQKAATQANDLLRWSSHHYKFPPAL